MDILRSASIGDRRGTKPKTPNSTRWNSTLAMLESVIFQIDLIALALNSYRGQSSAADSLQVPTQDEISVASSLIKALWFVKTVSPSKSRQDHLYCFPDPICQGISKCC